LYREYFAEPFPARTTITNCLGKVLFEIDVVGYVGA
jgi:2-iminobutanoate/2-iminopropanoate deaminase